MALNSIKGNRRRSILTIFTIALAVCMFWCILTFYENYSTMQKKEVKIRTGAYHAEMEGVSKWQKNKLEKDKRIKKIYSSTIARDLTVIDKKLEKVNVYPHIVAMEEDNSILPLYSGRMPQEINEIMMDKWVMETLGISLKLDQTIDMTFYIRKDQTGELVEKNETFKIVGIIDDVETLRMSNVSYIVVSELFLNKYSENLQQDIKILLKSNFNCTNSLEKIGMGIGINPDSIKENDEYMEAYDISYSKILGLLVTCVFIIAVAAIMVFNIYNIYCIQKINVFGCLKSIGFTDKQMVIFIYLENLMLSIAGSILGISIGIIIKSILMLFIKDSNSLMNYTLASTTHIINLSSMLVGVLIVVFALIQPINKILKLPVVKIIHYNPVTERMRYNNKNVLETKLEVGHLAPIYLSRYRKRTVVYIISIVTMGILFIVFSTVLKSADFENMTSMFVQGDFNIQLSDEIARRDNKINPISSDMIKKIGQCKQIEQIDTIMYDRAIWQAEDVDKFISLPDEYREIGIDNNNIDSVFYGYDDNYINRLIERNKTIAANINDMKTKKYIIVVQDGITNVAAGDKIHIKIEGESGEKIEEFVVAGVIQNNLSYRGYKASGCDIIMHQKMFYELGLDSRIQRIAIVSEQGKQKKVKSYLDRIIGSEKYLSIVSYEELLRGYMETKNTVKFISYAFILILFLIVLFNLINTTFTNIISRKREMGILQALGLTSTQLNRLLQTEGVLLSSISVVAIFALGIPLGLMVVAFLKRQANYMIYHFPIIESIVMTIIVFGVQFVMIFFSIQFLNSQSIVEKIKYRE